MGGDFFFVYFWATAGGLIIWFFPKQSYQIGAVGLSMIILLGGGWWAFIHSLWLPLIPSVIALISSTIIITKPFLFYLFFLTINPKPNT